DLLFGVSILLISYTHRCSYNLKKPLHNSSTIHAVFPREHIDTSNKYHRSIAANTDKYNHKNQHKQKIYTKKDRNTEL
ncbi:hypothetical protein, partial [Amphritea sp.]|uniref:hypothetical protein n=1 Tax=Amphritea sp. TaxID=1872502 RepID=UPI003568B646